MKKLLMVLISAAALLSVNAQRRSSVTLNVKGNANRQISIDGTSYTLGNTAPGGASAMINDLSNGRHTLQVSRGNRINNVTTFNLRNRYDMRININTDGTVELIETPRFRDVGSNRVRVSDAEFNVLLQNVKIQRPGEPRVTAVSGAFSNSNNYFTSAQVAQLLDLVPSDNSRLRLAKQSYPYVIDPAEFSRVEILFTDAANRDELVAYVNNYGDNDVTTSNANVYNAAIYSVMTDASFNSLYQSIRRQYSSATQYNLLVEAFTDPNNYFSSAQAIQLMRLQSNEARRLALAKMAYHSIADTYNYDQVYSLLYNRSSKDELAAYISNYQPGSVYTGSNNTHLAMSDYKFNMLVQNVRSKDRQFERMNRLTDIFNNSNNYFTSAQAKQLIVLVSAEDNRLKLAKAAYRNVVDRLNFKIVYDLLYNQSSKDELDAYIAAYGS